MTFKQCVAGGPKFFFENPLGRIAIWIKRSAAKPAEANV